MNTPSPFPNSFKVEPVDFQFFAGYSPNYFNGSPEISSSLSSGLSLEGANALYDSQTPISQALGLPGMEIPDYSELDPSWTFICTPEEISWTSSNAVNRVEMFGTNNPPAISGTKGMREFSLNNALVEGFTRNKQVEKKVNALENLLNYKSPLANGYVNVPVYQVWANQKGYGKQAFFLLKSVQVKETMRDLSGAATRAFVDVSFVEVPAFQVDSGIDQAPFGQPGQPNSKLLQIGANATSAQLKAAETAASVAARANQPKPNSPSPRPAVPPN